MKTRYVIPGRSLFRFLKFALPLLIAVTLYSCKQMRALPPLEDIDPRIYQEPIQREIGDDSFVFDYRGSNYLVEPMRYYELHGLVVTHNNIHSIADAYHTSDSVDVKDLCVIWGANVQNTIYQRGHFWSEPWTCVYKFDDRRDHRMFDHTALSNTHLLSQRESVRKLLQKVTVGDQIRLRGMLINYARAETPGLMRNSSLVRNDTGNGACEVMMVAEAEVLREGSPTWRRIHWVSKSLSLFGVILFPLLWLFIIFAEQRAIDADLRAAKSRLRRRHRRNRN